MRQTLLLGVPGGKVPTSSSSKDVLGEVGKCSVMLWCEQVFNLSRCSNPISLSPLPHQKHTP